MYYATITCILPGTNHVLTQEESLNLPRKRNIVQTVINNTIRSHPSAPTVPIEKVSPTKYLCRYKKCSSAFCNSASGNSATVNPDTSNPNTDILQTPHSFIDNTDSVEICMENGANRVIVNDNTLLTNFIVNEGKAKGVGAKSTTVT